MKFRKFLSILMFVFGFLNIANFMAPRPIPTVGPSAFIVGLLFIAAGVYFRMERDSTGKIQWGRLKYILKGSENYGHDNTKATSNGKDSPASAVDPMITVRVLHLAKEKKGILSISQTAMELNIPLDIAERALDECVSRGIAQIDFDSTNGLAYYRFPEFLALQP
ncbi:MAG: hypothetical protein SNJ56_02985 [Termitinemataceae bacterium]